MNFAKYWKMQKRIKLSDNLAKSLYILLKVFMLTSNFRGL